MHCYPVVLVAGIASALFTKSQVSFHFQAAACRLAAPTPVSAYLHSATMVKGRGIFLLARFYPALSDTTCGSSCQHHRHDPPCCWVPAPRCSSMTSKGLLAYSTISHLGLITLLFRWHATGSRSRVFPYITHATSRLQFVPMAAGIIDQRDQAPGIAPIKMGLWAIFMPTPRTLAMVAASAMCGCARYSTAFLSKEMFFTETLEHDQFGDISWVNTLVATLAGIFLRCLIAALYSTMCSSTASRATCEVPPARAAVSVT